MYLIYVNYVKSYLYNIRFGTEVGSVEEVNHMKAKLNKVNINKRKLISLVLIIVLVFDFMISVFKHLG